MAKLKTIFQIFGSFIGCAVLSLQFCLTVSNSAESGLTYFQGTIKFLSFMTILTNILVTLTYLIPPLSPGSKSGLFFSKPVVQSGVLVYILIVGIVYHFLLAAYWNPKGLWLLADNSLHYVVPVLYFAYWTIFTEKGNLKIINCIKWLGYPFVYIMYTLIRGNVTGMYPYQFLNISELGIERFLQSILFLTTAYIVMGLIIIFLDKMLFKLYGKKSLTSDAK